MATPSCISHAVCARQAPVAVQERRPTYPAQGAIFWNMCIVRASASRNTCCNVEFQDLIQGQHLWGSCLQQAYFFQSWRHEKSLGEKLRPTACCQPSQAFFVTAPWWAGNRKHFFTTGKHKKGVFIVYTLGCLNLACCLTSFFAQPDLAGTSFHVKCSRTALSPAFMYSPPTGDPCSEPKHVLEDLSMWNATPWNSLLRAWNLVEIPKNSCIETETSWLPGEVGPHQHKQLVCPVAKSFLWKAWRGWESDQPQKPEVWKKTNLIPKNEPSWSKSFAGCREHVPKLGSRKTKKPAAFALCSTTTSVSQGGDKGASAHLFQPCHFPCTAAASKAIPFAAATPNNCQTNWVVCSALLGPRSFFGISCFCLALC